MCIQLFSDIIKFLIFIQPYIWYKKKYEKIIIEIFKELTNWKLYESKLYELNNYMSRNYMNWNYMKCNYMSRNYMKCYWAIV